MTFKLDHIVHFVKSPEDAITSYQEMGLHAVEGGRHESLGTYNALSYFGLSYIELIGVFDQTLVERSAEAPYSLRESIVKRQFAEGLARVALRSTDLEADAKRFRNLGLDVYGPSPLSRKRPDGSVVSWKLLFVGRPDEQPDLPFFIQWDEDDDERKEDLSKRGVIAPHPAGNVELTSVSFAVKNLESVVERWSAYLGLEAEEAFVDTHLNAKGQRLKLEGGDLIFYRPIGDGIVAATIEEYGEKPFLLEFSGTGQEIEFSLYDAAYKFTK